MTPRFPYIFLEIVWKKRKGKSSHKIQKAFSIDFWLYCYLSLFFSFLVSFSPRPTFPVLYTYLLLTNVLIDLVLTHAHITHTHIHTQYFPLVITRGPGYFQTVFFILWYGNKFQPCPYRVIHQMSKKPVVAGSTSLKVCVYLCPSWWQEFAWTKAHLLLLVSKTTANVQNTNHLPSAFFPIVEVIPFPFFVFMPVYNLTPFMTLAPPSFPLHFATFPVVCLGMR